MLAQRTKHSRTTKGSDPMDESDEEAIEAPTEDAPLPANERRLITQSYDLSVSTLVEQWGDKTLVLPEIQREYVWTNAKASRLIESLLLNVPIPVLYFAEAPDDTYEVIDGHQRVASIARYIGNEFGLSGLQVLSDAEHKAKRFHQLPSGDQRRLRTRVIRAIIITDESHPSMKFEVFERLNTGSIALNAQEIRNSTHRGPFLNLVKRLVLNDSFRSAVGQKKPRRRMADHELVIRFFALRAGLEEYRPPLPRFLNNYCADANLMTEGQLTQLESMFALASTNVWSLFGKNSFRLTGPDGALLERSVNRALAETQLYTFARATTQEIQDRRAELLGALGDLHSKESFLDDIQRATGDRSRTLGRIEQYERAVTGAGLKLS